VWAGTRKVKPIWILLKQETVSGSGISWAVCKSAPRSRQISTPAPRHSVFYRLDALPAAQPTVSKHWRPMYGWCPCSRPAQADDNDTAHYSGSNTSSLLRMLIRCRVFADLPSTAAAAAPSLYAGRLSVYTGWQWRNLVAYCTPVDCCRHLVGKTLSNVRHW